MDKRQKTNDGIYPTKIEFSSMICDGKPCKSRTRNNSFIGPERVHLKIDISNDDLLPEDVNSAVKDVCQKVLECFY